MTEQSNPKNKAKEPMSKEDRLKAALKANLARRKAQARGRGSAAKQQSPKGAE